MSLNIEIQQCSPILENASILTTLVKSLGSTPNNDNKIMSVQNFENQQCSPILENASIPTTLVRSLRSTSTPDNKNMFKQNFKNQQLPPILEVANDTRHFPSSLEPASKTPADRFVTKIEKGRKAKKLVKLPKGIHTSVKFLKDDLAEEEIERFERFAYDPLDDVFGSINDTTDILSDLDDDDDEIKVVRNPLTICSSCAVQNVNINKRLAALPPKRKPRYTGIKHAREPTINEPHRLIFFANPLAEEHRDKVQEGKEKTRRIQSDNSYTVDTKAVYKVNNKLKLRFPNKVAEHTDNGSMRMQIERKLREECLFDILYHLDSIFDNVDGFKVSRIMKDKYYTTFYKHIVLEYADLEKCDVNHRVIYTLFLACLVKDVVSAELIKLINYPKQTEEYYKFVNRFCPIIKFVPDNTAKRMYIDKKVNMNKINRLVIEEFNGAKNFMKKLGLDEVELTKIRDRFQGCKENFVEMKKRYNDMRIAITSEYVILFVFSVSEGVYSSIVASYPIQKQIFEVFGSVNNAAVSLESTSDMVRQAFTEVKEFFKDPYSKISKHIVMNTTNGSVYQDIGLRIAKLADDIFSDIPMFTWLVRSFPGFSDLLALNHWAMVFIPRYICEYVASGFVIVNSLYLFADYIQKQSFDPVALIKPLCGMLALLFVPLLGMTNIDVNMEKAVKSMSNAGSTMRNVQAGYKIVSDTAESMLIALGVLADPEDMPKELMLVLNRVNELKERYEKEKALMAMELELLSELDSLKVEVMNMRKEHVKRKEQKTSVTQIFVEVLKDIDRLRKLLNDIREIAGPRLIPVVIRFCGLPGSGKSYLCQQIAKHFYDERGWSSAPIQLGAKFQNAWNDNNIAIMDDLFNDTTHVGNADLLQMISSNNFGVEKAAIEDKGTRFAPNLILCSSNNATYEKLGVFDGEAIERRFDLVIEVVNTDRNVGNKDLARYDNLKYVIRNKFYKDNRPLSSYSIVNGVLMERQDRVFSKFGDIMIYINKHLDKYAAEYEVMLRAYNGLEIEKQMIRMAADKYNKVKDYCFPTYTSRVGNLTVFTLYGGAGEGKTRFVQDWCKDMVLNAELFKVHNGDDIDKKIVDKKLQVIIIDDWLSGVDIDDDVIRNADKLIMTRSENWYKLGVKLVFYTTNYPKVAMSAGVRRRLGQYVSVVNSMYKLDESKESMNSKEFQDYICKELVSNNMPQIRILKETLTYDESYFWFSNTLVKICSDKTINDASKMAKLMCKKQDVDYKVARGKNIMDLYDFSRLFDRLAMRGNIYDTVEAGMQYVNFSFMKDGEHRLCFEENDGTYSPIIFRKNGAEVTIVMNQGISEIAMNVDTMRILNVEKTYEEWNTDMFNGVDITQGLAAFNANRVSAKMEFKVQQQNLYGNRLMFHYRWWLQMRSLLDNKMVVAAVVVSLAAITGVTVKSVYSYMCPPEVKIFRKDGSVVLPKFEEDVDYINVEGNMICVKDNSIKEGDIVMSEEEYRKMVEEGSLDLQSYVPKLMKNNRVRNISRNPDVEKQSLDPSGVMNQVMKNVRSICYSNGKHVAYGLGLHSNVLVSVGHLLDTDAELFMVYKGVKYLLKAKYRFGDRDMSLLQVVPHVDDFKDVMCHLLVDKDIESCKVFFGYKFIMNDVTPNFDDKVLFQNFGFFNKARINEENFFLVKSVKIDNMQFLPGDCGLPYLSIVGGRAVLVGIHQAIERSTDRSLGTLLTKELMFDLQKQCDVNSEVLFYPYGKIERIAPIDEIPFVSNSELIGKVKKVHQPYRTQIEKVDTYNKIYESGMHPAVLNKEMLYARTSNFGRKTKNFPQAVVDQVVEEMFLHYLPIADGFKILDEQQMLNGYDRLPKIDLSTSLGYPWNTEKLVEKGKKEVFENVDGIIDWKCNSLAKEIKFYTADLYRHALKGRRLMSIISCSLKDETRTLEKVFVNPKTRLFMACPIELILFSRKVIGSFISEFINFEDSPSKLGINPHSLEWDTLYNDASYYGDRGFDGDFSEFDSSMKEQIMIAIFSIIKKLAVVAEWSKEQLKLIDVLEENIIQSVLLMDFYLLRKFRGNPSGWPGTTVFNSLANEMMMLIVYKILCVENGYKNSSRCNYFDENYLAIFGDDNFFIPCPDNPWYNFDNVSDVFSRYDIKYTVGSKNNEGTVEALPLLNGISFLKRKFISRNGVIMAPLFLPSILEQFNWCSSKITGCELSAQLNELFIELSLHDEWKFDLVRCKFLAFLSDNRIYTKFRPFSWLITYNMLVTRKFETMECSITEGDDCKQKVVFTDDMYTLTQEGSIFVEGRDDSAFYNVNSSSLNKWRCIPVLSGSYLADSANKITHKIGNKDKTKMINDNNNNNNNNSVFSEYQCSYNIHINNDWSQSEVEEDNEYNTFEIEKHSFNAKDKGDETINTGPNRVEVADMVKTRMSNPEPILTVNSGNTLMDCSEFTTKFNYLQTVSYSVSNSTGQILYATKLNPSAFPGTHLEYLSKLYLYFNGSFEFHLSLTSTDYHAGKLMLVHIPNPNFDITGSYSLQFFSQYAMQIIDVRETQSIEVAIPYIDTQKALYMNSLLQEFANPGYFLIIVYSPLNAPDTVSPIVPINIMVKPTKGCRFLSLRNAPGTDVGGLPETGAEVLSSLLAPTPVYAPVGSPIRDIAIAGSGDDCGAYKYLNQLTVADCQQLLQIKSDSLNVGVFGYTHPPICIEPIVMKNGTIIPSPCDETVLNANGLIQYPPTFVATNEAAISGVNNVATQIISTVTALSTIYVYGNYPKTFGYKIVATTTYGFFNVPTDMQWTTLSGNITVKCYVSIFTSGGFTYFYVVAPDATLLPIPTSSIYTIAESTTLPTGVTGVPLNCNLYPVYRSNMENQRTQLAAQRDMPLVYSRYTVDAALLSTDKLGSRMTSFITGAATDLIEPKINSSIWSKIFNFIVDYVTDVGLVSIVTDYIIPVIEPIIFTAQSIFYDLNATEAIVYALTLLFADDSLNANRVLAIYANSPIASANSLVDITVWQNNQLYITG